MEDQMTLPRFINAMGYTHAYENKPEESGDPCIINVACIVEIREVSAEDVAKRFKFIPVRHEGNMPKVDAELKDFIDAHGEIFTRIVTSHGFVYYLKVEACAVFEALKIFHKNPDIFELSLDDLP